METPIYQEKQVIKFRGLIAFAMFAVLCAILFIPDIPANIKLILLVAEIISLLVIWKFMELTLLITRNEFHLKMGFIKKRFNTAELQIGLIRDIPKMAGIGLHYYQGAWVWNTSFGRGVSIFSITGKEYLIGSQNPEQFQTALLQVAKRRI